jgi:Transposase DDE domain group 1
LCGGSEAPTPTNVAVDAQGELFRVWRHHAIFTDSPLPMLAAEADHRRHAIIEQVIADLKNGPLAHLPSGNFMANSGWLVLAAMAFNLTRAAGTLASTFHARARTGTIRAQLIGVPARLARSAHRLVLHLPRHWPWQDALDELFRRALHDPLPTAA